MMARGDATLHRNGRRQRASRLGRGQALAAFSPRKGERSGRRSPQHCSASICDQKRPLCPAAFFVSLTGFSAIRSSALFLDAIAEKPLGIDWVETKPMLELLA